MVSAASWGDGAADLRFARIVEHGGKERRRGHGRTLRAEGAHTCAACDEGHFGENIVSSLDNGDGAGGWWWWGGGGG
jgi:hypothetical protein